MTTGKEILIRVCGQKVVFCPEAGEGSADGRFYIEAREGRFDFQGSNPPSAEELCGAGKILWDRGIRENPIPLYCEGIPRLVLCSVCENKVTAVTAEAGQADFSPRKIPMRFETPLINDPVTVEGETFRLTVLRFGDPYAVVFPETVGDCRMFDRWAEISRLHIFPQGAEVLFVYVQGETTLHLRAYHRDGNTSVRGNDICAALAAAVAAGRCLPDRAVSVPLAEGEARAVCTKDWNLFLTCPVSEDIT